MRFTNEYSLIEFLADFIDDHILALDYNDIGGFYKATCEELYLQEIGSMVVAKLLSLEHFYQYTGNPCINCGNFHTYLLDEFDRISDKGDSIRIDQQINHKVGSQ